MRAVMRKHRVVSEDRIIHVKSHVVKDDAVVAAPVEEPKPRGSHVELSSNGLLIDAGLKCDSYYPRLAAIQSNLGKERRPTHIQLSNATLPNHYKGIKVLDLIMALLWYSDLHTTIAGLDRKSTTTGNDVLEVINITLNQPDEAET